MISIREHDLIHSMINRFTDTTAGNEFQFLSKIVLEGERSSVGHARLLINFPN